MVGRAQAGKAAASIAASAVDESASVLPSARREVGGYKRAKMPAKPATAAAAEVRPQP